MPTPTESLAAPAGFEPLRRQRMAAAAAFIDRQFGFPYGTVTLAGASWEKHQHAFDLEPFVLTKSEAKKAKKPARARGAAEEEAPAESAPAETGAGSAPEIFRRVRRLVHHYRATPTGLPAWVKGFVTTGYAHYSTLLPAAFAEETTGPEQVAGMLAFLFTLESLALSLGCQRSQLDIAVRQAGTVPVAAEKLGLLWSAERLLGRRDTASIRAFFLDLLGNPLTLSALPAHLNGFVLALQFTPLVAPVVVELVSRAFASLPDRVLMPWLPGLIVMLRRHGEGVLPVLLKEAGRSFPGRLADLDAWQPPWEKPEAPAAEPAPAVHRDGAEAEVFGLLKRHPETLDALAGLLGVPAAWPAEESAAGVAGADTAGRAVAEMLRQYSATLVALRVLLSEP